MFLKYGNKMADNNSALSQMKKNGRRVFYTTN